MAKPEWGQKRTCSQCATRFYDMKKKKPVCPNCGTVYDPEATKKTRRSKPVQDEKPKKAKPTSSDELDELDDIEDIDIEDDDDDNMIESADDLGEDDLDMEDVVDIKHNKSDDE